MFHGNEDAARDILSFFENKAREEHAIEQSERFKQLIEEEKRRADSEVIIFLFLSILTLIFLFFKKRFYVQIKNQNELKEKLKDQKR